MEPQKRARLAASLKRFPEEFKLVDESLGDSVIEEDNTEGLVDILFTRAKLRHPDERELAAGVDNLPKDLNRSRINFLFDQIRSLKVELSESAGADQVYDVLDSYDVFTNDPRIISATSRIDAKLISDAISLALLRPDVAIYLCAAFGVYPLEADMKAQLDRAIETPRYVAEVLAVVAPYLERVAVYVGDKLDSERAEDAFERLENDPNPYPLRQLQNIDELGKRNFFFRQPGRCPFWGRYDIIKILGAGAYGLAVLYVQNVRPDYPQPPEGELKVVKFELVARPFEARPNAAYAVEARILYEIGRLTEHWTLERKRAPFNHVAIYDSVMCTSNLVPKLAAFMDMEMKVRLARTALEGTRTFHMMIQQFADGGSLRSVLSDIPCMRRMFSEKCFASMMVQIFGGLAVLGGLIELAHGDLKPDNVLLSMIEPSSRYKYLFYNIPQVGRMWVPVLDSYMTIFKPADFGMSRARITRTHVRDGRRSSHSEIVDGRDDQKYTPGLDVEVFLSRLMYQAIDHASQFAQGENFMSVFPPSCTEAMARAFSSETPQAVSDLEYGVTREWKAKGVFPILPPAVVRDAIVDILRNPAAATPEKGNRTEAFYYYGQVYWSKHPHPYHVGLEAHKRLFSAPLFDAYRVMPVDAVLNINTLDMTDYRVPPF